MTTNKANNLSQEQIDALKDSVVTMAVESWRLFKVLDRLLNSLDVKEQQRYQSKIRWFVKKAEESLKTAGFNIVNYEGRQYDPGIPASPINLEDFQQDDQLYVTQMLEPVILDSNGNIIKTGTIALGRIEK
jgi:hypothetical protein